MDDYTKRLEDFLKSKSIPVRAGQVPISKARQVGKLVKEFQKLEDVRVFKASPSHGPHGFVKDEVQRGFRGGVDWYCKSLNRGKPDEHIGAVAYENGKWVWGVDIDLDDDHDGAEDTLEEACKKCGEALDDLIQ